MSGDGSGASCEYDGAESGLPEVSMSIHIAIGQYLYNFTIILPLTDPDVGISYSSHIITPI